MIILTVYLVGCLITTMLISYHDISTTGELLLCNLLLYLFTSIVWPFVLIMAIVESIIELPIWDKVIYRRKQ